VAEWNGLGAMCKRAGFGGLKIESIANAAGEIARIVGFLQDGESLVLGFLQQADVGAVAGSKMRKASANARRAEASIHSSENKANTSTVCRRGTRWKCFGGCGE
jgi:hypothetical protein